MNLQQVDITRYGFLMLQIETMSLCNMRCDFCGYTLKADKESVLPEETVLSVIDSLSIGKGFQHICLSHFNEPLLDERIYSFINHANGRKLPVMIITNGILFNSKDVIARLLDAAPKYIKVSLQLLDPGMFFRVRKSGCDFQRYKKGVFEFLTAAQKSSSEISVDIACNFLCGMKRLKKMLGLEYGDPSVYNTVNELREDVKGFLKEFHDHSPFYKYDENRVDGYLNGISQDYLNEPGFSIWNNVSLKIKPFIYGRRITEFYPVQKARPCASKILGILADGSVVPCCMAYDDNLSLGNVCADPLGVILERSSVMLNNIRTRGAGMPSTCQHCMGAPTRRGVVLKKLQHLLIRG